MWDQPGMVFSATVDVLHRVNSRSFGAAARSPSPCSGFGSTLTCAAPVLPALGGGPWINVETKTNKMKKHEKVNEKQ